MNQTYAFVRCDRKVRQAKVLSKPVPFWSLFRRPALFSTAITYAIYGFHFRKIFERSP